MEKFEIIEYAILWVKFNPYKDLDPIPEKMNINPGIDKITQQNKILTNSLFDEYL